jgi:hypothetical protein
VIDLIDFRAFSSIWYWLLLGLVWTRVIHAPFGVPFDLLRRADRNDPRAIRDVEALTAIEIRHRDEIAATLGAWEVALWAFVLALLGGLALGYGVEPAQALLLLAVPLALVRWLIARAQRRIVAGGLRGADLRAALRRLRALVQAVGMTSVFVSALWGMFRLLAEQSF